MPLKVREFKSIHIIQQTEKKKMTIQWNYSASFEDSYEHIS